MSIAAAAAKNVKSVVWAERGWKEVGWERAWTGWRSHWPGSERGRPVVVERDQAEGCGGSEGVIFPPTKERE